MKLGGPKRWDDPAKLSQIRQPDEVTLRPPAADVQQALKLDSFSSRQVDPHAYPIKVPPILLQAFRTLDVDPVLSGGSAVQVWTGRSDDLFKTFDLDFITHIQVRDLEAIGLRCEIDGRHALVDGIPIEFPVGPLGVGDLDLDLSLDTVIVPTVSSEAIRCIRSEACVLDRLALVAGSQMRDAFLQAAAVVVAQANNPTWDQRWIDKGAKTARLGNLWEHLKSVLERGNPTEDDMDSAIQMGWDPVDKDFFG